MLLQCVVLFLCCGLAFGIAMPAYNRTAGYGRRFFVPWSMIRYGSGVVLSLPPSYSSVIRWRMVLWAAVFHLLGHICACCAKYVWHMLTAGLFVLMYLICSLYLVFISLPVCPIHTLLHVLHFISYMPLEFICSYFSWLRTIKPKWHIWNKM